MSITGAVIADDDDDDDNDDIDDIDGDDDETLSDSEDSMDTAELFDLCLEDDRAMILAEQKAHWGEKLDDAKQVKESLESELASERASLAAEMTGREHDVNVRDTNIAHLEEELRRTTDDKAYAQRENASLRKAVQDGYRHKEVEIEMLIRHKEHIEKNSRRNRGTQISCFTCEQRGHAPHAMHPELSVTEPETVPSLTAAFNEEVVLRARARDINYGLVRDKSQTRQKFDAARTLIETAPSGPAVLESGAIRGNTGDKKDGNLAADGHPRSQVGYPGDTVQPHRRLKQPFPHGPSGSSHPSRFSELKNMPMRSTSTATLTGGTSGLSSGGGGGGGGTTTMTAGIATAAAATALRTQSAPGKSRSKLTNATNATAVPQGTKPKKERVQVQTASYLQRTLVEGLKALDAAHEHAAMTTAQYPSLIDEGSFVKIPSASMISDSSLDNLNKNRHW